LSRHKAGVVTQLRPANNGPLKPDEVDLDERKAIVLGGVPEPYRDAWARLQVQKPATVPETQWRQVIEAAARFFGQWGKLAADFGWMPGDIFDIPTSDGCSGLIWWIASRTVTALGPAGRLAFTVPSIRAATAGEGRNGRSSALNQRRSYAAQAFPRRAEQRQIQARIDNCPGPKSARDIV
jgi:hypothetical protein